MNGHDSQAPAELSEPIDGVRLAVVARTRGSRALLVTNRHDPQLAERLTDWLKLEVIDVATAEPRRVAAAAETVTARKYDLVLAVTGFMDHSTDAVMKVACNRAGVIYVRVAKGRPAACVRALAREFGVGRTEPQ